MRDGDIEVLADGLRRHIYQTFPEGVSVPQGVTEDEAICAVQQQFTDAGYEMSTDSARNIVHRAWDQAS
jgi:hypothetical protein